MPIGLTHNTTRYRFVATVDEANKLLATGWVVVNIATVFTGTDEPFRFTMQKRSIFFLFRCVAQKINKFILKCASVLGITLNSNRKKFPASFDEQFSFALRRCFPESSDLAKIVEKWRTHKRS